MNVFDLNPTFYGQPFRLTEEQQQNPTQALKDFFEEYHLIECRHRLAELAKCALTGITVDFQTPSQRERVIDLCEKLEELLEAAFILKLKGHH